MLFGAVAGASGAVPNAAGSGALSNTKSKACVLPSRLGTTRTDFSRAIRMERLSALNIAPATNWGADRAKIDGSASMGRGRRISAMPLLIEAVASSAAPAGHLIIIRADVSD